MTELWSLCSPPLWVHTVLTTPVYGTSPTSLYICLASSRWLPPSAPPRELWTPAWPLVRMFQRTTQYLVSIMFSGNLSCFPRPTFICQSCAVPRSPVLPWALGFSPAPTQSIRWCCRWSQQSLLAPGHGASSSSLHLVPWGNCWGDA